MISLAAGEQETRPAAPGPGGDRVVRLQRRWGRRPPVPVHHDRQGPLTDQPHGDRARVENVPCLVEGGVEWGLGRTGQLQKPAEPVHPAQTGVLPERPRIRPVGDQQDGAQHCEHQPRPGADVQHHDHDQRNRTVECDDQRRQHCVESDLRPRLRALGQQDDALHRRDGQREDGKERRDRGQPGLRLRDVVRREGIEHQRSDDHLGREQREVEQRLHQWTMLKHGDRGRGQQPYEQQGERVDEEQADDQRDLGQGDRVVLPSELDVQVGGLSREEGREQGRRSPER
jgi:hypothetical protein